MSLLNVLLCDVDKRYTAEKIKSHRFFKGMDWKSVESLQPPFIMKTSGEVDTSNFEVFPECEPWVSTH